MCIGLPGILPVHVLPGLKRAERAAGVSWQWKMNIGKPGSAALYGLRQPLRQYFRHGIDVANQRIGLGAGYLYGWKAVQQRIVEYAESDVNRLAYLRIYVVQI